jgi:hypothetical protein
LRVVWRARPAKPRPKGLVPLAEEVVAVLVVDDRAVQIDAELAQELERAGVPTATEVA